MASHDREWKARDPNLPTSPWWFKTYPSDCVGFRLVRPLDPLSDLAKQRFWEADIKSIPRIVAGKLLEGRGIQGNVTPQLPTLTKQMKEVREKLKLDSDR
jgi:sulfatase modifying factor 1